MSDERTENAFAAARELSGNFFKQAEDLSPAIANELLALRRDYLRAWANGVDAWLDLSEDLLKSLNVEPKLSSDIRHMARDVSETWIKAEQEFITGAIGMSRSLLRATAAGSQTANAAGFRAANAAISLVRARVRDSEAVARQSAQQVGSA